MSRTAVHEGPSIWSWATAPRILRKLRLKLSKRITPSTEDMMAAPAGSSYVDVQVRLEDLLLRRRECPAGHPVAPFELRALIPSLRLRYQVLPNADGHPTPFIPIRIWLCLTCQTVYRQREIVEVADAVAPATMEYVEGLKGND